MRVECITHGPLETNTYIVYNENNCLIIDPEIKAIDCINKVKELNVKVEGILLTHGHFDHIGAANELAKFYDTKIYASAKEKELLANADMNMSSIMRKSIVIEDYEPVNIGMNRIGDFTFEMIETPGHTSGSVCFLFDKHLFAGDTLFYESYGRYDFPTGSFRDLRDSVAKLLTLKDEVVVYPGHGMQTSIEHEKKYNAIII